MTKSPARDDDSTRPAPTLPHALDALERAIADGFAAHPSVRIGGTVTEISSSSCRLSGLSHFVRLGECVEVAGVGKTSLCEVVRIDAHGVTVKPFDGTLEAGLGTMAWACGGVTLSPDRSWKGRTLNALGKPIDGLGPLRQGERAIPTDREPPAPMRRQRVRKPVKTGIRVIDLFTPLCAGQRIGIFAGSGVGKSTLLSMLARAAGFDTTVLALVGERGREVREFLEDALGREKARTIAVVATGDESPMMRRLAPKAGMCIAEHLRDHGENVLLIVDSVTRFAHAARDVALSAGEPPVARGYPPSVFSDLPRLLERAGAGEEGAGSITGVFAVLVDGDDHNDPVADSIRGTLDGHIVLDRAIAEQGRYPPVNVLSSVSRLTRAVLTSEQQKLMLRLREMIAQFEDTRDLRLMGGYHSGTDPGLDKAIQFVPRIYETLRQAPEDPLSGDAFQDIARALAAEMPEPAGANRPTRASPGTSLRQT
jgi:flagellum-specific ATP synthase